MQSPQKSIEKSTEKKSAGRNRGKLLLLFLLSTVFMALSWQSESTAFFVFFAFVPVFILLNDRPLVIFDKPLLLILSFLSMFLTAWFAVSWIQNVNPTTHLVIALLRGLTMFLPFIVAYLYVFYGKTVVKYQNEGTDSSEATIIRESSTPRDKAHRTRKNEHNPCSSTPVIAFIAAWMIMEILHDLNILGMSYGNLGHVLAAYPKMIQWYSVTGNLGGTLWILLVNYAVFLLVQALLKKRLQIFGPDPKQGADPEILKKIGIFFLIAALPVIISVCMYRAPYNTTETDINIIALHTNMDVYDYKYEVDPDALLNAYIKSSREYIDPTRINIVFWPENAVLGELFIDSLENAATIQKIREELLIGTKTLEVGEKKSVELGRYEARADDAKSVESGRHEAQAEDAKSVESGRYEAQANDAKSVRVKEGETKGNEAETNEAETNEAEGNKAETNEAEGNKAEGNKAETNDPEGLSPTPEKANDIAELNASAPDVIVVTGAIVDQITAPPPPGTYRPRILFNQTKQYYFKRYNTALYISERDSVGIKIKKRLVPMSEQVPKNKIFKPLVSLVPNLEDLNFSPSDDSYTVFKFGKKQYRTSPIICYGSAFSSFTASEVLHTGSDFMAFILNEGWMQSEKAYRHFNWFAICRAIENRRFVVKSSNEGITALIDSKGAVMEQISGRTSGAVTGNLEVNEEISFYTKFHQAIVYGLLTLATILLIFLLLRQGRCKGGKIAEN